ncbi:crossover junction endodeoxyribonuclease RuvC [Engelhardtia mirabilis]|uniref:crossover junction endodeoxyribonuclease RuvC n=1 Tax=Engelhardtia mirabilis TaxID=2528011 RepID=UPI003AF3DF14
MPAPTVPAPTVLGIDPGTRVMGYGAVTACLPVPVFVRAGVIQPRKTNDLPGRLAVIAIELEALLEELHPSVVVVERAFTGRNVQSALRLGEARGVAIACAARSGAMVVEITPAAAKRAVAGSGSADKDQVAAMVMRMLGLVDPGGPRDATDALAMALAHALQIAAPAAQASALGRRTPGGLR